MGDEDYYEQVQQDWKLDGKEIIEILYLMLTAQKKLKNGKLTKDETREPLCSKKVAKTISTILSSYLHPGVVLSIKKEVEIMREMLGFVEELVFYLHYSRETYDLTDAKRGLILTMVVDNVKSWLNRSVNGTTVKIIGKVIRKTITENRDVTKEGEEKKLFGKFVKRPEGGDEGVLY